MLSKTSDIYAFSQAETSRWQVQNLKTRPINAFLYTISRWSPDLSQLSQHFLSLDMLHKPHEGSPICRSLYTTE